MPRITVNLSEELKQLILKHKEGKEFPSEAQALLDLVIIGAAAARYTPPQTPMNNSWGGKRERKNE